MAVEVFANKAASLLNGAITSGATSLVVVSASTFPTTGNFRILIDNEIILVRTVSGATFSSCLRGSEGTTAASHADQAPVTHILTAAVMLGLQAPSYATAAEQFLVSNVSAVSVALGYTTVYPGGLIWGSADFAASRNENTFMLGGIAGGPTFLNCGGSATQALMYFWVNTTQAMILSQYGIGLFNVSVNNADMGHTTKTVRWGECGGAPSINPSSGAILAYVANAAALKDSLFTLDPIGTTTALSPASFGTVNTQAQKQYKFTQYGRITASGSTLTIAIPLATSSTSCQLTATVVARIVTAGTVTVVGDTFVDTKVAAAKNVAATVSIVGTVADTSPSQSDTSIASSAISFAISGTSIVVTFTATAASGTLGTCDVTIVVGQIIN